MAALMSLGEYSRDNNIPKRMFTLYLYASGAQRQVINVLSKVGFAESYTAMLSTRTRKIRRTKKSLKTLPAAAVPQSRPASPSSPHPPQITEAVVVLPTPPPPLPSLATTETTPASTLTTVETPVEGAAEAEPLIIVPGQLGLEEGRRLGSLYQLSDSVREEARRIAATGLYGVVYDNINMNFANAEQILGRHGGLLFV